MILNRRQALGRIGFSVAGLTTLPRLAWVRAAARVCRDDIAELASRIRAASRQGAFDLAAEVIAAGTTREDLLGAVFLAGVEDIRPRPHGILHSVMMVESAFQLAAASATSPRQAWHPVLFNLDDFKVSQARDRREASDYRMQPLAAAPRVTAEAARREFSAAMDAFDGERAERAVAALVPHVDADAFFELLRPFAARCYAFIGHKVIYAVQVERVLRRIGWQYAEPALRSLVLALLVDRRTDSFDRARELAPSLPVEWLAGNDDPAATGDVLGALREASPTASTEVVISAVQAGVAPSRVWDALVVLGSEVFQRRPGKRSADGRLSLLPVHALTVPSALRHAFLTTRSDATRRILLLQAAAWTASLRDDLGTMVGLSMEGPGLEATSSSEVPTLDSVFESGSPARARELLERRPASAGAVVARLRGSLARCGREHHQHKYAAAMLEEASRVHERFRPLLIAPAVDYLANPADEETEVFSRAGQVLDKAGVR